MYTKGDFHLHTTASDGECTPSEIVDIAKKNEFDIIAITDHNTTFGIEEAIITGEKLGVKVIPGIEISTRYKGRKVHVLGYFIKEIPSDEMFQKALHYIRSHDIEALESLLGDKIDVKKDCIRNRIDTKTGVELLKYFGALVVLAHPIKIKDEITDEIMNLSFDGIEAVYFKNTIEDTEFFKNIALDKGWFYTAGSDFHTDDRLDSRHGKIGDVFLNRDEIDKFLIRAE